MNHKRPEDQTVDEWLHDYVTSPDIDGRRLIDREPQYPWQTKITSPLEDKTPTVTPPEPLPDHAFTQDTANTLVGEFHYSEHWTFHKGRKTGSLSLTFIHVETSKVVSMFFNVALKNYKQGKHGQFIPSEMGKFRAFWRKYLGKPPSQWSRAHHGLKKLRNIRFIGTANLKYKETGETYWELVELEKIGLHDFGKSA